MTIELVEARVSKAANGGVGLYVRIRGTREEVCGEAGLSVVADAARARGWDPDGPADAGFPVSYGLRTLERSFHIGHCLCHGRYGCPERTAGVIWNGFSGQEPDPMGTVVRCPVCGRTAPHTGAECRP